LCDGVRNKHEITEKQIHLILESGKINKITLIQDDSGKINKITLVQDDSGKINKNTLVQKHSGGATFQASKPQHEIQIKGEDRTTCIQFYIIIQSD